jgi:hypothetical protein
MNKVGSDRSVISKIGSVWRNENLAKLLTHLSVFANVYLRLDLFPEPSSCLNMFIFVLAAEVNK